MIYGLDRRVFVEDGPAVAAARTPSRRAWRILRANERLASVEGALRPAATPANDFPIAL